MDSLLVISDEPALADTLSHELPGISIEQAPLSGLAASLGKESHRLILLDENGGTAALPETVKIPVLKLTRPIRLSDLLYTIRERLQGKSAAKEELPMAQGFRLFPAERLLRGENGDAAIPLTEKETELLQCLLEAGGQAIARDMLLKRVWGYSDDIATHTLETHIYRLRGKLRQASEALDIVFSEEGGYQLNQTA